MVSCPTWSTNLGRTLLLTRPQASSRLYVCISPPGIVFYAITYVVGAAENFWMWIGSILCATIDLAPWSFLRSSQKIKELLFCVKTFFWYNKKIGIYLVQIFFLINRVNFVLLQFQNFSKYFRKFTRCFMSWLSRLELTLERIVT